jgi:short-subunit dehydrogenase
MAENVVIVGASSGIAQALADVMAQRGCQLLLAGRRTEALEHDAAALRQRHHAMVHVEAFDALDYPAHAAFVARCCQRFGGTLDGVVIGYGLLVERAAILESPDQLREIIDVNFTSVAMLAERFAAVLEGQRHGYLAVISSVAGDRGRPSNYPYGASKAGLSAYLQGLRARLFRAGVHVLTIKPGYVDTPMIAGRTDVRSALVASPQRVAREIDRAIRRRSNVLYTPWYWRIMMALVRALPEAIFKRLRT